MPRSHDPSLAPKCADTPPAPDLADFGWRPALAQGLTPQTLQATPPVRVTAVHRSVLQIAAPGIDLTIPIFVPGTEDEGPATVGDWLLYDPAQGRAVHLLPRLSLFQRRAPGTGHGVQLIAANVDTVFIVTSCNEDFNIARLERYLALAHEAGAVPVVVLTKADLTDDADAFADQARALMPGLCVEVLDATDPAAVARLKPWCGRGQTVAFLGSSGVGKSTLVNGLIGAERMAVGGIREDDAKGRHTTSHRELIRLPQGGWVLDTPGMRELQLTEARQGLEAVFGDIDALAQNCRFRDCAHEAEPGCAVQAAIASGVLDADRMQRWRKLLAEDRFNSQSLAERRSGDRAFGKMIKRVQSSKPKRR